MGWHVGQRIRLIKVLSKVHDRNNFVECSGKSDIFCFRGAESNKGLHLRTPKDGASIIEDNATSLRKSTDAVM